jgi:hypothetical protein
VFGAAKFSLLTIKKLPILASTSLLNFPMNATESLCVQLLRQRDSMNTDAIASLSDKLESVMQKIKQLEDRQ